MMYSALILDLKKSRRYSVKNRESIQNYLVMVCKALNRVFAGKIERDVGFSAGDEIQGLFKSPQSAYLFFRLFAMLIHPVKIRAGIGVGTWDIKIDDAGSTAQDGQVYHRARDAIHAADGLEGYSILYYSGGKNDAVVNSLIGGAAGLGEKLNTYQNEMMLLAELMSPIDLKRTVDTNELFSLIELAANKDRFEFFAESKRSNIRYPFNSCFDYYSPDCFASPVDAAEIGESFYITDGRQRGLPSKLAAIMGVSRQSVEKTLKTSNIFVARNMTISALRVMLDTVDMI